MVKAAEDVPAATVSVAGTVASAVDELLSVKVVADSTLAGSDKVPPTLVTLSLPEAAPSETVIAWLSLSVMLMLPVALLQPATDAVTVTLRVPSITVSSTAVGVKVTDDVPAGIVTVAGTVSSVVSLDDRLTVTSYCGVGVTLIVPWLVKAPAFSAAETGRLTVSVPTSLSVTMRLAVPFDDAAGAEAVRTVVCEPSSRASSTMVIGKLALVCPDKMVTVAGKVAAEVTLELRLTMISDGAAEGSDTVPVTVPAVSLADAGALRLRAPSDTTLKLFDVPVLPLVAFVAVIAAVPVAPTLTFPVHTPATNAPVAVGVTGNDGESPVKRMLGSIVEVPGEGDVPDHVSGSPAPLSV